MSIEPPKVGDTGQFSEYPRPHLDSGAAHDGSIPEPPNRVIGFSEHLLLSSYWFGSNFVWGALLGVLNASVMANLSPGNEARLIGFLSLLGAFPALVIPLVAGALSDRCASPWGRRRPYIFWGGLIAIAGLVGLLGGAVTKSLELYFAAFFVLQFGANTALAAYSGVIPDVVPKNQHGIASGYMAFMSQFSTLIGAFLGGRFASNSALIFTILIVVFSIFLVLSMLGIKETPLPEKPPPLDWGEYLASLWRVLVQYPDFAWVWITRALMMFGFYAIQPYILYYLRDMIHIPIRDAAAKAGVMIGLILIGATVSGMIGGALSDRTGRKPIVYASSFLIGIMSLSFIFLNNMTQVMICGVIFGIGYGAYISVDWALGTDVLPSREDAAKDMGVWHVSMTLPQLMSPFIASFILQAFVSGEGRTGHAHYSQAGYAYVFVMASLCFILGGVFLRNVRGAK